MMLLRLSLHGGVTIHKGYVCFCGLMANHAVPGILRYALFRHFFLLALLVTLVVLLTPADSVLAFKIWVSYVVNGECVLRYDNEAGKGDHRHWGGKELHYRFSGPEKLLADFQRDIERWNHENGDS